MALSYLALALALAFSLNAANRFFRASGTLLAALALVMLVVSIIMADFDGTFRSMAPAASRLDPLKPLILNIQAAVATVAAVFLFWASWLQLRRPPIKAAPPFNTASTFGLLSRSAHWITATLILCLIPMGLFISVLKAGSPDRAEYLAAHQSLGLAVLGIAGLRLFWLLLSPPPAPPAGSNSTGTPPCPRCAHRPLRLDTGVSCQRLSDERLWRRGRSVLWVDRAIPRGPGQRGGIILDGGPRPCSAFPLLCFDFCACGGGLEAPCPGRPQGRHSPHAGVAPQSATSIALGRGDNAGAGASRLVRGPSGASRDFVRSPA